jgi:hypothetical protein
MKFINPWSMVKEKPGSGSKTKSGSGFEPGSGFPQKIYPDYINLDPNSWKKSLSSSF